MTGDTAHRPSLPLGARRIKKVPSASLSTGRFAVVLNGKEMNALSEAVLVYLNGRYLPPEQALVSFQDRGFVFADGIYEVIRCYGGVPFRLQAHLNRLAESAAAIWLPPPPLEELNEVCRTLLRRSGLAEASLYLQVTRGAAPRQHLFPPGVPPTLLATVQPADVPPPATRETGVAAVTVPDERWDLCQVKSIGLLANVLAKEKARRAGAYEAVFVRDGVVTEGASSNLFAVWNGRLRTHPAGRRILAGVTRTAILETARAAGLAVLEDPFTLEELRQADEIIMSSTVMELMPVTRLDGAPIGAAVPGAVHRTLAAGFAALVEEAIRAGR